MLVIRLSNDSTGDISTDGLLEVAHCLVIVSGYQICYMGEGGGVMINTKLP